VLLRSGVVCRVYRWDRPGTDDGVAVLTFPRGRDVEEVVYRRDESVLVVLAGGGRHVKWPSEGMAWQEDLPGNRLASHGPRPPLRFAGSTRGVWARDPHEGASVAEAFCGTDGEAWLRGQGAAHAGTAVVRSLAVHAAPATTWGRRGLLTAKPAATKVALTHLDPKVHLSSSRGAVGAARLPDIVARQPAMLPPQPHARFS